MEGHWYSSQTPTYKFSVPTTVEVKVFQVGVLVLPTWRKYRKLHKILGAARNVGGGWNFYLPGILWVKTPSFVFLGTLKSVQNATWLFTSSHPHVDFMLEQNYCDPCLLVSFNYYDHRACKLLHVRKDS